MENLLTTNNEYREWIVGLKQRIKQSQLKAAVKVNTEMLQLYWSIGEDIVLQKAESLWGSSIIEQISKDLSNDFPDIKGFSPRNLWYMKKWYLFYYQEITKLHQVGAEIKKSFLELLPESFFTIPWRHHVEILTKSKNVEEALFYINKTVENGWSRNVLLNFLSTDLYHSQGKSINNFNRTLPELQSDLAQQTLKDPYNFDFLSISENFKEKELEDALIQNITQFLLELGSGFAYVGRQVKIDIGEEEFFIDLLFYQLKLRCYVVVELKTGKFKAEYVSKLGLYVSAINHQMKHNEDKPTVGLLICKNKDSVVAKYTLESTVHSIGISEYQLTEAINKEFKSTLPSIKEIEEGLNNI